MLGQIFQLSYAPKGGAGRIAVLLSDALRSIGLDSQVVTASPQSVTDLPAKHPIVTLAALLDSFVFAKRDAELVSILRSKLTSISRDLFREASVVNLHWTTGAISSPVISELLSQGVKVAWTLHDYRPLTGACHYLQGCQNFQSGCQGCPQVRPMFQGLVAGSLDRSLADLKGSGLALVAPSSGLFDAAKASTLASGNVVTHIPYPADFSGHAPRGMAPDFTPKNSKFLFVAANVMEERKGLHSVLRWWSEYREPGEELVIVGKNSERFTDSQSDVRGAGELGLDQLRAEYKNSAAVVFASSEDNAPGVLVEAAIHGLPVVCLNPQMTDWLLRDGFPVQEPAKIRSIRGDAEFRSGYAEYLSARNPQKVAGRYEKLYLAL